MRLRSLALLVVLAATSTVVAASAGAQPRAGAFEAGFAWGRSFGGTFPAGSTAYFAGKVESDTAILKGVRLAYGFDERWSVEVLGERVDTRFVAPADGVFASRPELGVLQMRFVEIGPRAALLRGRFVPFAGAGVGLAVLDPDIPGRTDVRDANRFSTHLDAGFKAYFRPWLGFRLEVRPRFVYLGSGGHWFRQVDGDAGLFAAF